MSGVSNTTVQQVYLADGVTLNFSIPFFFQDNTAENVTQVYLVDKITGIKTLQVIGALNDYTLPHNVGEQPALVVFRLAPAATFDVLLTRQMSIAQAINFLNSGQMLLANCQSGMDILTMLIQQVNQLAIKSLRLHEIDSLQSFDPTFPPGVSNILNAGRGLRINDLGTGLGLGLSDKGINDALTLAQIAATSAQTSAGSAAGSATSANTNALNAAASAVNALASAVAAAASAAAAAASAASGAGVPVTQTTVIEGATTALSGDTNNSAVNNMVDYSGRIKRGTTVLNRTEFTVFYRNGAWEIAIGFDRWANADSGVTWTVNSVTGAPSATVASDGRGSAIIDVKKIPMAI